MRIGAKVPNFGPLVAERGFAALAGELEAVGFDSLWLSDHVVIPTDPASRYPFSADGKASSRPGTPWFDALVSLAQLAAATTQVEIGIGVLVLPLREPVTLAKQLASIDVLAGGRVTLGVGAGWLAEEFAALGVPFSSRGARMDEAIDVLRAVWTGSPEPYRERISGFRRGSAHCLPGSSAAGAGGWHEQGSPAPGGWTGGRLVRFPER